MLCTHIYTTAEVPRSDLCQSQCKTNACFLMDLGAGSTGHKWKLVAQATSLPTSILYPGGHVICRPPKMWMCKWYTDWQQAAVQSSGGKNPVQNPRNAKNIQKPGWLALGKILQWAHGSPGKLRATDMRVWAYWSDSRWISLHRPVCHIQGWEMQIAGEFSNCSCYMPWVVRTLMNSTSGEATIWSTPTMHGWDKCSFTSVTVTNPSNQRTQMKPVLPPCHHWSPNDSLTTCCINPNANAIQRLWALADLLLYTNCCMVMWRPCGKTVLERHGNTLRLSCSRVAFWAFLLPHTACHIEEVSQQSLLREGSKIVVPTFFPRSRNPNAQPKSDESFQSIASGDIMLQYENHSHKI